MFGGSSGIGEIERITQMLVSKEDAGRDGCALGRGVARTLSGTPERFKWWLVTTVIAGYSVSGFYVITHSLMSAGMEAKVSR